MNGLRVVKTIAVIGAGISGLTCARALSDAGMSVTVFDKGRGPAGRTSTRRNDSHHYDHGAQFFTVSDSDFRSRVEAWQSAGVVEPWDGTFANLTAGNVESATQSKQRFVGVRAMNAIAKHCAQDLTIKTGFRVASLERRQDQWCLSSDKTEAVDGFDTVIITAPVPQAVELLEPFPGLSKQVAEAAMAPCWTVMAGFENSLPLDFDAANVTDNPLSWIARNNSKPGRPNSEAWVLQANPDWSAAHLEEDREAITESLLQAFAKSTGQTIPDPLHASAHRWRFALVETPLGEPCLFDTDLNIGACGDWCLGPRIELAYLSGAAMAERVLGKH